MALFAIRGIISITLTPAEIQTKLENSLDSIENCHRFFSDTIITDGVKNLIELCECNWLIQAIASYQEQFKECKAYPALRYCQFWKLDVDPEKSARLTCTRDGEDPVFHQDFLDTTFPLDTINVWVGKQEGDMVIYLPWEVMWLKDS